MSRFICFISCFLLAGIAMADHHKEKQYIELRYYQLKSEDAAAAMDEYFASALIPALNRAGVESVGVFKEEDPSDEPLRLVVIPHDQISDVAQLNGRLAKDRTYQDAGSNYLTLKKNDTPLVRIRSELVDSFRRSVSAGG